MSSFDFKKESVARLVADLLLPLPFMKPLVDDGWSLPMAKKGWELHSKTWRDLECVREQIEGTEDRRPVREVCHVWPALPGAGVSPVLFGILCGVEKQDIKASRRGTHFANYFAEKAKPYGVSLVESPDYSSYDRLIVSGSEETLAHFSALNANLIGFGHRESIAIVDASFRNFLGLVQDISQWRQQGCFSVRAIFFVGQGVEEFMVRLAAALSRPYNAPIYSESELVTRLQKRALLEMTSRIIVDPEKATENIAWVHACQGAWGGASPAPGCVDVLHVQDVESLLSMIAIPAHQRQGVALGFQDKMLGKKLIESGFTLISQVGEMQSPPLSWQHDGRSNVEMFFAKK